MRFEWDEAKSELNLQDRGFDFEFASLVFDSLTPSKSMIAEATTASVARRIISARRSSRHERKVYEKANS